MRSLPPGAGVVPLIRLAQVAWLRRRIDAAQMTTGAPLFLQLAFLPIPCTLEVDFAEYSCGVRPVDLK